MRVGGVTLAINMEHGAANIIFCFCFGFLSWPFTCTGSIKYFISGSFRFILFHLISSIIPSPSPVCLSLPKGRLLPIRSTPLRSKIQMNKVQSVIQFHPFNLGQARPAVSLASYIIFCPFAIKGHSFPLSS